MRVALVLVVCVVGCKKGGNGPGDEPAVKFADISDNGKLEALAAGSGGGITLSRSQLSGIDSDAETSGCPTKEETADGVSYTGGCVNDDEDPYEGSVLVRNLDGADTTAPIEAEYDGWSMRGTSDDGDFSIGPYTAEGQLVEGDLDAEYYGLHLGFRGAIRCAQLCSPEGEVTGWTSDGTFGVDGEFNGSGSAGWIELTGKDVLRVDDLSPLAQIGGCVDYTLDGKDAGELCLPSY